MVKCSGIKKARLHFRLHKERKESIMKIGIIVHSHTGNTYSVAQRLKEELLAAGHALSLEKVIAVNDEQPDVSKIQLKETPDASEYDALIFGAPVRGFSLSPVMKSYLSQIVSLKGKKIVCYVTEYFPYPWMGGNRAVDQMKKLCETKGTEVFETRVINWSNRQREKKITNMVEELNKLF